MQLVMAIRSSLTAALVTIDALIQRTEEEPKSSPMREHIMETMGQPVETFGG